MEATGKERRRHRRFSHEARCWCNGQGVALFVSIINASLGGLFVKTYTPFNIGEKVTIRWKSDDGMPDHHAEALVVWRRCHATPTEAPYYRRGERGHASAPGMGLKFLDLPEKTRGELEKLEGGKT